MASSALRLAAMQLLGLIAVSHANEFLRATTHDVTQLVSEDEIRTGLLQEIDNSLPSAAGTGSASHRFSQIEEALRPIYAALPKNGYGNLEHPAAHYALHRLFKLRHGWAIKGLGPASDSSNTSSPAGVLKDQVPSYIENLFEERLAGKGFKLHDLAVLAATIEHLVQEEAIHRMRAAFNIHDTQSTGRLDDNDVDDMLDTYMASYILSENLTDVAPDAAAKLRSEMPEVFHHWRETQEFVRGIRRDVDAGQQDVAGLTKVIVAVGEQFGSFFQDNVCMHLKHRLLELEYHGSGRIRLSDFYKPALDGFWIFGESVGYLRQLGVLEEVDPKEPSVLIANYLAAPANCIATSGFHSVCCKNECDGLLGHFEQHLAATDAAPEAIAALAADLPSSSSPARGALSGSLRRRLDEIAAYHGGLVPLHGRLFSQWLHHAYPRECPYPHISGTTSPRLPEEWMEETGMETTASDEEMQQYIQWSRNGTLSGLAAEDLITWSSEEELLVVKPLDDSLEPPWGATTKPLAVKSSWPIFAIAAPFAYALVRILQDTTPSGTPEKFEI